VPELIEVEIYRQQALAVVGRRIAELDAADGWYLKGGLTASTLETDLVGGLVAGARRIGKLLLLDVEPCADEVTGVDGRRSGLRTGLTVGLRFGMTGRLVVDGEAAIEQLLYTTSRHNRVHERFAATFEDGTSLVMVDPRRLGGVELEPDTDRLGPDAAAISDREFSEALRGSAVAVKARLLDQRRVAGVGNLIADEVLWRAGVRPTRTSGSLEPDDVVELAGVLRATIRTLQQRGGSHMGDLQAERHVEGRCPRDGARLQRCEVGGRTTYWCRVHQR